MRTAFYGSLSILVWITPAWAVSPQFNRDILPILADKCFHCHGPDEEAREADLRLDTKEGLFRKSDGAAVINPGKSSESELHRRITSSDPDTQMPPPSANRALTPRQVEQLQQWIDSGAEWSVHWAFQVPSRPVLPSVKDANWCQTDVDRFVLSRLEAAGLSAAKEATRETWLRRVTFDLTGLPPTLVEMDAFLTDAAPDAQRTIVDRLLQSPRYAERMATDWMDISRFADTHGYQMDRTRPMWPYRDWVIRAFQQNLPYDQFVTWQLAGDLLPSPTKDQQLATAFNRLHMQNEEGGIVEEEFRVAYVVDRVNTFGTAFLAQTFECCRCHDHKYDPLTQKDFYSLFAFFQNIDESGQTSYFTAAMPVPAMLLTTDEVDRKLRELREQVRLKAEALAQIEAEAGAAFEKWLTERPSTLDVPGLVAAFDFDVIEQNKTPNSVKADQAGVGADGPQLVQSPRGSAVALTGENGFHFPGVGHFSRVDPFSLGVWVKTPTHAPRLLVLHHSRAPIDAGSRGYELLMESGRVAFGMHHMWPGNSLKIATRDALPIGEWTHIAITYDGSSQAAGLTVFIDGHAADCEIIRDGLTKDITYGGEPDLSVGYRFRDNGFKGGEVDELRVFNRELTALEVTSLAGQARLQTVAVTPSDQLSESHRSELRAYFLANVLASSMQAREELRVARNAENEIIQAQPEAMVMAEMLQPKPAFTLKRGNYDQPIAEVVANTPAVLPPFPADQPRNRLGLARWLLDGEHPLTARVTVNRVWQQFFGRGLVETSDNFGSTGSPPSHPELLDWLARDFVEHGWDLHHLIRQISLSATYRQSSQPNRETASVDPSNQLLSRAAARRLTAEMLRDQALFVSGLLVERIGGPSVKPYQPAGLWEEKAMGRPNYDQGKGDDLYRRSLYTFWKRTVPHPAMIGFDAADRNNCAVRRQSTSTPLQALVLLNDEQHVEAARFLSQRMLLEGGATDADRIAWIFRTVTGRGITAGERSILLQLLQEQRELFAVEKEQVQKLLAVGQKPAEQAVDRIELAAGAILAQALLNFDEVVNRR